MVRPLRTEYANAGYRVTNRGHRHDATSLDPKGCQTFIALPKTVSNMFRAQIAAYALMPTHYHLLLRTPEGNITRTMRHVGGVYTQIFNQRSVRTHSTVSTTLTRGERQLARDEEFKKRLAKVRTLLKKSQNETRPDPEFQNET